MGAIRILSADLVNRIAAGECVERPASVVKELLENSLDSGARQIDVAILDGGRELIQVADDGGGMTPEDLRLSVHPHATSKIPSDDDLFNIRTMGFRGEALASIGSIARLRVTSRRAESELAARLSVEGGQIGPLEPCAGRLGTTVEVRDLFFCVPARRKFLKTSATEVGHITEQFARVALAHPGVGLSLRSQNRVLHQLAQVADARERLRDFFGPELSTALLAILREGSGVRIEGWVCPPGESRGSSRWEYVFVNGRFIRDRFVSHAIKEAYRSLIDPSRFPVAFLFITIDPREVDVNVHPTKVEVRWRDSNYIHAQVLATLREKFLTTRLDHSLRSGPAEDYRERVRDAMVDFFTSRAAVAQPHLPTGAGTVTEEAPRAHDARAAWHGAHHAGAFTATATLAEADIAAGPRVSVSAAPQITAQPSLAGRPPLRAIQIHNAYLVVEASDGLELIDQHALHERILYEELRRRFTARSLESQRLLLPDVVHVPAERIEALETHAELLTQLGVELSAVGPAGVALHGFPTLLERADRPAFVRDLLDLLAQPGARPGAESLIHSVLDMMACKAAVKAGDSLTADEIAALLARRDTAERSSHCPHGRPTTLRFSLRELERQFKRR